MSASNYGILGVLGSSNPSFNTVTSTVATGTPPLVVASSTNIPNLNASSLNGKTFANPGAIGTTPSTGAFTTISASGAITSTLATGTAPFTIASTTNVANLNASSLSGATFASPGAIGGTVASSGAFTTLSASGAITSTLATGTAPFTIASTTNVPNLNASTLSGKTFADPGPIGSTTRSTGAFTTINGNSTCTINGSVASAPDTFGNGFFSTQHAYTDNTTAASGTTGIVAFNSFRGSTIAATNANVTTSVCTSLYLDAPTVSTNQTVTLNLALYVHSGNSFFSGDIIQNVNTASTSSSTGTVRIGGGYATTLTTDAVSSTNGGTFTSAGGLAVAKKIIGGSTIVPGYTTTATAAGTTTLTTSSTQQQYFTGSTTQTLVLPVTSTLLLGLYYDIVNLSTGSITVNSSGGNLVATVTTNTRVRITCILTSGTSAASWSII